MESKLFCFYNTPEHLLKFAFWSECCLIVDCSQFWTNLWIRLCCSNNSLGSKTCEQHSIPWRLPELGRTHHASELTPKSLWKAAPPTRARSTISCEFPLCWMLFPCLCSTMLCTFPTWHQTQPSPLPFHSQSAPAESYHSRTCCNQQWSHAYMTFCMSLRDHVSSCRIAFPHPRSCSSSS